MFTPQEVSEKTFPKASFSGGYNMAAVDEFLDSLVEDYTALYKENATLKAKLKVLAEKVEEYRATEDAMRSTLLAAQKMAANMVEEAKAEKEQVLAKARAEAAAQVADLEQQTQLAKDKLVVAQQKLAEFVTHSQQLCAQQAAFLQQLPEMDAALLAEAAPVAVQPEVQEDVLTQDTVRLIEKDILANFQKAQEEPVVEETPVVEEAPAQPVVEEIPVQEPLAEEMDFTTDFKLDLEELKFGRNYTGEK